MPQRKRKRLSIFVTAAQRDQLHQPSMPPQGSQQDNVFEEEAPTKERAHRVVSSLILQAAGLTICVYPEQHFDQLLNAHLA